MTSTIRFFNDKESAEEAAKSYDAVQYSTSPVRYDEETKMFYFRIRTWSLD